jgi:hypothetical protein
MLSISATAQKAASRAAGPKPLLGQLSEAAVPAVRRASAWEVAEFLVRSRYMYLCQCQREDFAPWHHGAKGAKHNCDHQERKGPPGAKTGPATQNQATHTSLSTFARNIISPHRRGQPAGGIRASWRQGQMDQVGCPLSMDGVTFVQIHWSFALAICRRRAVPLRCSQRPCSLAGPPRPRAPGAKTDEFHS